MTEKEVLNLEKENYTTIHLHRVGIFWRAYQRSALGFCKEIRSYLGFPDTALQEVLAARDCIRVDDTHIMLMMDYLSDEEVASLLPKYVGGVEKALVAVASVSVGLYSGLPEQITAFPLHNSTPLECMNFIARLQNQLSSDGAVR